MERRRSKQRPEAGSELPGNNEQRNLRQPPRQWFPTCDKILPKQRHSGKKRYRKCKDADPHMAKPQTNAKWSENKSEYEER